MFFLHLESFENKLFELDFSIFQKACFYGQTSLGMWIFLHGYDIFLWRFLVLSIYKKNLIRKYQTILSKKSHTYNLKLMKEYKKIQKKKNMSHHWPQCAKWFLRYLIPKSAIWARWALPFCRFLASFSLKYDVTDAILQDIEKMKVQYLRSLLFDLF